MFTIDVDKSSPKKRSSSSPRKIKKLESKLNDEEQLWVLALQDAIRRDKVFDLTQISEWDLACHALVAKSRPSKVLHRLRRLQIFRETYRIPIVPTVYQAIQTVHDFVHSHPNFIHAVGKDALGRWVISFQLQGLASVEASSTAKSTSTEGKFTALYYIFCALQPDLESVRAGTIWIGDLRDTTRQTLPLSIVNGARALCRDAFPIKVKDVPCWNSPPKWSAVFAMCRSFFSPHFAEKLVWDCEPAQLQQVYPKTLLCKELGGGVQTQNDILDVLEENLKRRFENQELFRLNMS